MQWVAAYLAAAWLILQVVSTLSDPWHIPDYVERGLAILLGVGLFVATTIAWYHGEQGRQTVSGPEILIIAALLALAAIGVSFVDLDEPASVPATTAGAEPARADTVAVLPFTDLSPGQDYRYFADGMAEEIISALTRSGTVRVAAKTSSFAMRGQPITDVGEQLAVAAVLEGSVRTDGETLRVTVELVDTRDGFQIWSQQFDRRRANVLQIQDEIANAIVTQLTGSADAGAPDQGLIDPEAYDSYLQARYLWNRRNETNLRRSREYYLRAIELEPGFARAYSGLADTYAVLGFYQYLPPSEAFPEASRLAARALEMDPRLAEALATQAYVKLYFDRDWAAAEKDFREAIRIAPQYAVAHQWYANLLVVLGRWDEAEREVRASMRLDPLSLIARSVEPWVLYYEGEYERALELIEQVIDLDPRYMLAYYWRGWILQQLDRFPEAIDALRTAVTLSEGSAITRAALAHALALGGEVDEARSLLADLVDPATTLLPPAYEIAKVYVALGERDAAISWLDKAFTGKANQLAFIGVDPELDALRGDPEFDAIVARMSL